MCGGNDDAVALIEDFWRLCEVWDDAIDGEKNESDVDINRAFLWALFGLNDNAFYREHPELRASLQTCIANWQAANVLERSGDREKVITAYTLRCSPYDFFVAVVLAAGGMPAAYSAALYFRSAIGPDRLEDYLAEHLIKE
jgi:hypothetical protein